MTRIADIQERMAEIRREVRAAQKMRKDALVFEPYYEAFLYRFCWSSNHLEGNTLSLDETVAVIDFDEVACGHTFSEYREAKSMFAAAKLLSPGGMEITEEWIRRVNGAIMEGAGEYRSGNVYIGTKTDVAYYPPRFEDVPARMREYMGQANKTMDEMAQSHIRFERIHPFADGNGRTGRMILNQQLLNNGYLPVALESTSKYRRAFREGDDPSLMAYLLCKAEERELEELARYGAEKTRAFREQDGLER